MIRLPQTGQDEGEWGELLNRYLLREHSPTGKLLIRTDGTLDAYYNKPANGIPKADLHMSVQDTLAKAEQAIVQLNNKTTANGTITLTKNDIGLAQVDNTADADKPISNATQAALDSFITNEDAIALAIAL